MGADEALENELGLGELAGLTVANEADSLTYDVSGYYGNSPSFCLVEGRCKLLVCRLSRKHSPVKITLPEDVTEFYLTKLAFP